MQEWPLPYEDVFLDTRYGRAHVIVSGPEEAPPLLLLHASGVAAWSWKYNIGQLGKAYRSYAVDLIGDAGKSEYANLNKIMKTGKDQAELCTEITDKLGVDKAYVVGASEGGFIGSNHALYAPERVEKLILLGPMGYSGATKSIMRIIFAQFFPFALLSMAGCSTYVSLARGGMAIPGAEGLEIASDYSLSAFLPPTALTTPADVVVNSDGDSFRLISPNAQLLPPGLLRPGKRPG